MVIRAGRDDDALRAQGRIAALDLQARPVLAIGKCERERLRGSGKFRAETVGLKLRAVGQVAAADAGGKAEEVLDQAKTTRPGRPARSFPAPRF